MKKGIIILLLVVISVIISNSENQFWEAKQLKVKEMILHRIIEIESKGDPNAFNPKENAAGLLQIRPIMVDEINRLLKQTVYNYNDRWCPDKSIEMFIIYQDIVNPKWNEELAARKWNGGISGHKRNSTLKYWNLYLNN